MGSRSGPSAFFSQEELDRLKVQRLQTAITRPTPALFPWAESLFTIGVTGTNGKTTTTQLLAAALQESTGPVLQTTTLGTRLGNEALPSNQRIGLFLKAAHEAQSRGTRYFAAEVTSTALAGGFARMWRFDAGILTSIDRDHLHQHGSFEHYLASKAQLFALLGPDCHAILNDVDPATPLIETMIPADVRRSYFGDRTSRRGHLKSGTIEPSLDGTEIVFEPSEAAEQLGGRMQIRLIGDFFAENALAAALCALRIRGSGSGIVSRMAAVPAPPGRFQVVHRSPTVVVDFAHTPRALARCCELATKLTAGRTCVVFGAGGERDPGKRQPMGEAVGQRADRVFITNDNPRHEHPMTIARALEKGVRRGGKAYVTTTLDRGRAIERALDWARADDFILVAGKGHETGQEIGDEVVPFSDVVKIREILGLSSHESEPLVFEDGGSTLEGTASEGE